MYPFRNQSGISLISVVVALGLMGGLATGLATLLKNGFSAQKAIANDGEFEDFRRTYRQRVNCPATGSKWAALGLNPMTCSGGSLLPLFDKNGNVVVSTNNANPTSVGSWTLRGVCFGGAGIPVAERGIDLQAAKPRKGATNPLYSITPSDFATDQMRNVPQDWDSASTRRRKGYKSGSSIFMTSARLCPELFAPAGTDPPQPLECMVVAQPFKRNQASKDGAGWRHFLKECPNSHPVAVSSSMAPSCFSPGWNATVEIGMSYPRRARCSQVFYRDVGYTAAEKAKLDTNCVKLGGNPENSVCNLVCCRYDAN